MLRVGLTGNVASGKSSVADVWRGLGAPIVDADLLARMAVARGTRGLRQVVARFGAGVLDEHGALDRAALRARVFANPEERAALEAILHPEIQRLRLAAEADLEARGARVVVHVIPLLFETGLDREMDKIVLVDAPESTRLERLMRDRGLDAEEAKRMIEAQEPATLKRASAAIVIENDSTLEALEREAAGAWEVIRSWVD